MKHITFLYRNQPTLQEVTIKSDDDAIALFNDILTARSKDVNTLLISSNGGYKMINPMEIIDLTFMPVGVELEGLQ